MKLFGKYLVNLCTLILTGLTLFYSTYTILYLHREVINVLIKIFVVVYNIIIVVQFFLFRLSSKSLYISYFITIVIFLLCVIGTSYNDIDEIVINHLNKQ